MSARVSSALNATKKPRRAISDRTGKGGGEAALLIVVAMGLLALVFWWFLSASSGYTSGSLGGNGFQIPLTFWTILGFGLVFTCIIAVLAGGSVRVGRHGVSAYGAARRGRR